MLSIICINNKTNGTFLFVCYYYNIKYIKSLSNFGGHASDAPKS